MLLQTAWRLMREDAGQVTMARVAREAGVSRQAAYLYFESWAGLLLALVRWVDETHHFADRVQPAEALECPQARLEGLVKVWLDYLEDLHPVPGYLARARQDDAAKAAWGDRMKTLEDLYRRPIRELHQAKRLRPGVSIRAAVEAVRAIASVHAWERLIHECGWNRERAADMLWWAVEGAILRPHALPGERSR